MAKLIKPGVRFHEFTAGGLSIGKGIIKVVEGDWLLLVEDSGSWQIWLNTQSGCHFSQPKDAIQIPLR